MAKQQNKLKTIVMKEIKIKGSENTYQVPDHVVVEGEAVLAEGLEVFIVEPITEARYTNKENRVSMTMFNAYESIDGTTDTLTKNAMSLINTLKPHFAKCRSFIKVFAKCRDINGKVIFNKNKMTPAQLSLFSFLQGMKFDIVQVRLKAGSPNWDNPDAEPYTETAVHTELQNIKLPSDEEMATELATEYAKYIAAERAAQAAAAAAEAREPLPEL